MSLFLETLQNWSEAEKGEQGLDKAPEFTIFFHNLKGFDGVLTTNTLYNQNLKVTDLKKGFFPYKFSKLENWRYEGPIPDLKYYELQHMTEEKKEECETWLAQQVKEGKSWNFQTEMLDYCKSDVQLLREGCLKFAEDTMQEAGFIPLTQCITIASACQYFWLTIRWSQKRLLLNQPLDGVD